MWSFLVAKILSDWSWSVGKALVMLFSVFWIEYKAKHFVDLAIYGSAVAMACYCQPAAVKLNWVEIWDKVVWTKITDSTCVSRSIWIFVQHLSIIHAIWRNVCRCCCRLVEVVLGSWGKKAGDQPWGQAQQQVTEASLVSLQTQSTCLIHKCVTIQIDCLIFQEILQNFHVVCAVLLRHWGRCIIFLPAAELVCKNIKSGWIDFIVKHSLCSTANTMLSMVICIYCWDESKENTTCML